MSSTEQVGRHATPFTRVLSTIHAERESFGLNPKELIRALDRLVKGRLWEGQVDDNNQPMTLERALMEPWPVGVGLTLDALDRLWKVAEDAGVDAELIREVRSKVESEPGHNITRGTAGSYTRRRLARDHRELYNRVQNGELSASAAAVEAGFRKPTATVPVDTADNAVRALARHFPAREITEAIGRIAEEETHDPA